MRPLAHEWGSNFADRWCRTWPYRVPRLALDDGCRVGSAEFPISHFDTAGRLELTPEYYNFLTPAEMALPVVLQRRHHHRNELSSSARPHTDDSLERAARPDALTRRQSNEFESAQPVTHAADTGLMRSGA